MNQTLHNLTLTGRITFADGSIFDSASGANFANVSGFSRNLVDGTTSLLQDRFILHQDVACATTIQCPQLSFQVLEFINDVDDDGVPILQTRGFSNELRDALLLAKERTTFLASIFNDTPIGMGWTDNDISVLLDYTGLSLSGVTDTHRARLTSTGLEIIDSATSDGVFLDQNGLVLLEASTQQQIEFTTTSLMFHNPENAVSIGHSTYLNSKVGVEVFDPLTGSNCNLEPHLLTFKNDSGATFSSSATELRMDLEDENFVMTSSSFQISDMTKNTSITSSSITVDTLNYVTLNPPVYVDHSLATCTSTNQAAECSILFVQTNGSGAKTIYVDDVTGPLQYNPSLSQLSCRTVYSNSTTNTMSLLFGASSNQFKGWTSPFEQFSSGISIASGRLYLSAISVTALQAINGFTVYYTQGASSTQVSMGLYSSSGVLLGSTPSTNAPSSDDVKRDYTLSVPYTPPNSGTLWVGLIASSSSLEMLGTVHKIISPTPTVGGSLNVLHATFNVGSFNLPNPITNTVTNSGSHVWAAYW